MSEPALPPNPGRDELAPLVAKHSVWLDGRKFLLVPYHLLDARSLEQRMPQEPARFAYL